MRFDTHLYFFFQSMNLSIIVWINLTIILLLNSYNNTFTQNNN